MEFNLFLWPMVIPMILPFIYCVKYKKEALVDIIMITIAMVLIVVLYWPFLTSNIALMYTYPVAKCLLFVVIPVILLFVLTHKKTVLQGNLFGLTTQGLKHSVIWCLLLLPMMIAMTGVIHYAYGVNWNADISAGAISFLEAFTEEFFFRGILFIYLSHKTNVNIAYMMSLTSFVLMHPQNLMTFFIIGTIVQGILTLEIARRSQNIIGSWMLHGSNRFFNLVLLPLLM